MINMKVIRLRAKVVPEVNARLKEKAATKTYTEEHLREVYQRLANEYGKEQERLHNELIFAHQENERLRATLAVEKKKASEAYDLAVRASADLAARLVKVMDRVDEARDKVAELNIELMERGARIEELEQRIEWLLAHPNTETEFVS